MDTLLNLLEQLTKLFGGNLGVTLIFIGIVSRAVFYPLLKSSYKHLEIQRQLKPKLDALKKKYAGNKQKLNQEQAKLMLASGFNPVAGCLPLLVQLVVGYILFVVLGNLIKSGIDTHFWYWDLAKPDVFNVSGVPFGLPGLLGVLYALATLIQAKMMMPQPLGIEKSDSPREVDKKEDLAESLAASQGPMVFLMPLFILLIAGVFPSGLALYFLVNTLTGIVLQYYISGLGGLSSWLKIVKR